MKWVFLLAGTLCVVLIFSGLFPQQNGIPQSSSPLAFGLQAAATAPLSPLTAEEKRDLLFMAEEEKMARDVYFFLHKRWKLAQFNSIARSEEQHVGAVVALVQRYGLPDPVSGSQAGQFSDQHLAALYDQLVARGNQSVIEALRVGGLIEEVDILDLEAAIQATGQPDIRQVYGRIQRGSFNHLRAFSHALELIGHPYQPVKLTNESLQSIIHSPMIAGF